METTTIEWQDNCDIPKRLDSLKLDYYPHEKDAIAMNARSWYSDTRAYGCRMLGYGGNLPIFKHHYKYLTDSAVINWTHTFTPTMVNEFGIGFTGEKERSPADNLFGRTVENYFDPVKRSTNGFTLGQLYPGANVYDIMPQAFFNFVPDGPNISAEARFPDHQGYERFHFLDNFSWIRSKHTFKFGLYFERNWSTDGPHADCFDGCFDFTHDVNNPAGYRLGFLQRSDRKLPDLPGIQHPPALPGPGQLIEWFAQDTFKVTRKVDRRHRRAFLVFQSVVCGPGFGRGIRAEPLRSHARCRHYTGRCRIQRSRRRHACPGSYHRAHFTRRSILGPSPVARHSVSLEWC